MKITKRQLTRIIKEELASVQEVSMDPAYLSQRARDADKPVSPPTRGSLSQGDTNAAKGAAMALLDVAKAMEEAPSHDPASRYAREVTKQAKLIMDVLVAMGT